MSDRQANQLNPALRGRIQPVVERAHRRRTMMTLAVVWGIGAVVAVVLLMMNRAAASPLDTHLPHAGVWVSLATLVATIGAWMWARSTQPNVDQVAHQIESEYPELDAILLTAIEQRPNEANEFGYLQQEVILRALHHSHQTHWENIIPNWQLGTSAIAALFGFVGLGAAAIALLMTAVPKDDGTVHRFNDVAEHVPLIYDLSVQPGNTEVEKGTRLLVLAQFHGDVPPEAELSYTMADGTTKTVVMTKSLDDPVFAGRITQVKQPLKYRVRYSDRTSDNYDVSVYEFPRLERSDADLKFPEYTKRSSKHLQDVRRITAVVGTEATFKLKVNKPLASAVLVPDEPGEPKITLAPSTDDPTLWVTNVTIDRTRKYRLNLSDASGRGNKSPPRFAINAMENRTPKLKLVEPSKDVQVSALEEINLEVTAWDDFGLKRIGVSYSIGGNEPKELVIDESKPGKKKHAIQHLLELEQLNAVPDQLIAYHFWAEDLGPDGNARRTASDMYFAEVRPFEEIYRQAQGGQQQQQQQQDQQQQQGNQNAQQASKLAELQKEIINATWRVIRRETRGELTQQFEDDVRLLIESQQSAFAQADELQQKLEDDESKMLGDELLSNMSDAIAALSEADTTVAVSPLTPAMRYEHSAYQTLLKMRAREFEVQQQQMSQQQMQQQQQGQQQRQMQQLDMKQQADRYEQERQAQEQQEQTEEQRENRQILSRLRELARRQNDLNERIKELQSALEEAESEEEQDEIQRQLKRLEEEQRQILRDTDELQERMQQPQNQEQMAEQSQQLEQARDQVQRSAESLKEGDVSQAAAEGTRAERELKELRDEFQKRTSGQFNEEMRQMRNRARDLEKEQMELAQEMADAERRQDENTSLTAKDNRDEIVEKLAEGSEAVEELRERMKNTIEEAEEYEPLLADKLYDAFRETEQSRPDKALDSARRSLQRGLSDVAEAEHQRATEGIQQLREGIDEAAESVLGDETEALKLARNSIEQLNRQLENEIRREDPSSEREESQRGEERDSEDRSGNRGRSSRDGARESEDLSRDDQPAEGRRGARGDEPQDGEQRDSEPQERERDDKNEPRGGQRSGESRRGNEQQPQNANQSGGQREQQDQEEDQQRRQNQRGQQGQGQPSDGEQQELQDRQGSRGDRPSEDQPRGPRGGNRLGDPRQQPRNESRLGGGVIGGNDRQWAPISGDDYRDWSDMLRDVEEMMADPDLRAEAARIRDRARAIRRDLKRHSAEPNWDLIKLKVAQPLAELNDRVGREILRRDDRNARVPLNREPVPPKYEKAVQRYYEQIGAGK